ncbi:MAG: M24 family metallopeptidase [Vicinamibacterales bacterium]
MKIRHAPVAPAVVAAVMTALLGGPVPTAAQIQYPDPSLRVLTHREQAPLVKGWITKRFDTVLPGLMSRAGLDMWIVVSREYNDDPVFRSMAPLTTYSSRRRTILVFVNPGGGKPVERYSVGRFDYEKLYTLVPTANDAQWEGLRELVERIDPKTIGVNESEHWNHADGLTANEKRLLLQSLGEKYATRVTSAEMLAVGWLEYKLPEELEAYRHVMQVAHLVIRTAFSNDVITPGTTTTDDVVWWMRQRVAEMGLGKWFHPSVTIWRQGGTNGDAVIRPGDMLHTDFGLVYLGFSTDTQHLAYVLKAGETDAPAGLREGLKAANRLQDLTMQYARLGRTGNQALRDARMQAVKEGLVPSIYCHAVGYHGHAAGPPIGMTDYQEGVPVRGDYVFRANTWHSIELNATHKVPEWGGQDVRFALEEDAALMPDGSWSWVASRQERFHLIAPGNTM